MINALTLSDRHSTYHEATSDQAYCSYQANPKESHLVAIKRIFRYLKGTLNLDLCYPNGSGFDLKAYSDYDYAGCNLDRKNTSGVVKSLVESWCVGVQRSKTQWPCHQLKLSMLPLMDAVLKSSR
ncbi:hypothetical protein Tco_1269399 [Tanacetum coccineum]